MDHVRDAALDGDQLLFVVQVQARHRVHQRPGVGVVRVVEDVVAAALFDDLARVHDDDVIGHIGHDTQVVGDHDDGHAELLLQLLHQLQNLRLDGDVQGGGRLVGDQQLGVGDQGSGDHDALPLAAGKLMRVFVHTGLRVRDADQLQHLLGPFLNLRLGEIFVVVVLQVLHDLFADHHGGV